MAETRFCVGFSSACKQAREGGGLPGCVEALRCVTADGCRLFYPRRLWLPPDIVRLIDELVRRLEHEDALLAMNEGELGETLCRAAWGGKKEAVRRHAAELCLAAGQSAALARLRARAGEAHTEARVSHGCRAG